MPEFADPAVESAFASVAEPHKVPMLRIRELIFDTAAALELPGGLDESLKWGEPSYVPAKPKIGSAMRLASFDREHVGLYFNCQTTLVEGFRSQYGDELTYSKNRAILFGVDQPLPEAIIDYCARAALHYHLDKKR